MSDPFLVLLFSAAALGTFHTAIGIDHSVPIIVLARTRAWSWSRTLWVTLVCGLGHVLSSVLIAAVGLGLGVAGSKLAWIEQTRGTWAAWLLVGFGLSYAAIAYWNTWRRAPPRPGPQPSCATLERAGEVHRHLLAPEEQTERLRQLSSGRVMPALFVVFLLGPCEALLPLLTAGGITLSLAHSLAIVLVFCAATIGTMLILVAAGCYASSLVRFGRHVRRLERHGHAWAGLGIAASGMSIQVLGI